MGAGGIVDIESLTRKPLTVTHMGALLSLLKGGAEAKPIDLPIDFNGIDKL